MLYRDPPSADAALIAYLLSVVAGVAAFALIVIWLMQPTVIPNGGLAAFEKERRSTPWLALRSSEVDTEQSAIALALQENETQGLRPLASSSQSTQSVASPKPAAVTRAKVADTATRPKPKRVAKVQRREYGPDPRNNPRNAWAYAPNGGFGPFGGFGSWFR